MQLTMPKQMRNMVVRHFQHPETEYWISEPDLPPSSIEKCMGDEDNSCMVSEDDMILAKLMYGLSTAALALVLAPDLPEISVALFHKVGGVFGEFSVAHSNYITYL
jgi:hypothetical protein